MARKSGFDNFREDLLGMVWEAQEDLWHWSLVELASEAGLCNATVYRLYNGDTKEPRLSTIYKLAKAVGMSIKMINAAKNRRAA